MRIVVLAGLFLMLSPLAHAETVNLYAAGSLKAALTELARAFENSKAATRTSPALLRNPGPSPVFQEGVYEWNANKPPSSSTTCSS